MCGKDNPDMGEEMKKEKSVEDMVPTRFHKYLSVFKKRESEHLPLCKPWDHAIETKSGFQPKKSKVYALSPKEQKEVDDSITANCIIVGSKQTIRLATKIVYLEVSST